MSNLNFYNCYGLNFVSDLALPEMVPLADPPQTIDIRIEQGIVNPNGLSDAKQIGPFLWATPTAVQLHIPNVARFLIRDGNSIIYAPQPGTDEASIRVFMLGSCLGVVLFHRGFLVLHGNAVQVDDGCIVCVGHSGAGKSTLAAAFSQRGYKLLADDVVPVDQECRAIPGFPRIKLWKDAADKLKIPTNELERIRPDMEKFNFPIVDSFMADPLPVRQIYILNQSNENVFLSENIPGLKRFSALYQNTYRKIYLDCMELKPDHLKLCGKLASRAKVTRITRPRLGFEIDHLVEHILTDLSEDV